MFSTLLARLLELFCRICSTLAGLSSKTARPQTSIVGRAVHSTQHRILRQGSDELVEQTTRAHLAQLLRVMRGVSRRTGRTVHQKVRTVSRNGVRRRQPPRTARRSETAAIGYINGILCKNCGRTFNEATPYFSLKIVVDSSTAQDSRLF